MLCEPAGREDVSSPDTAFTYGSVPAVDEYTLSTVRFVQLLVFEDALLPGEQLERPGISNIVRRNVRDLLGSA